MRSAEFHGGISAGVCPLTFGSELAMGIGLTLGGAGSGDTIIQAATISGMANLRVFSITGGKAAISRVTDLNGSTRGITQFPSGDGNSISEALANG